MKKAVLIASVFLGYVVLFSLFVMIYFYGLPGKDQYVGTTITSSEGADLRQISISTCSGDGDLFLYEGDPFQDIDTSFENTGEQVLIFSRSNIDNVNFSINGNEVTPIKIEDNVYTFNAAYGSTIAVEGTLDNGARGIQGYLSQDPDNPVYDVDTFQYVYDDSRSDTVFLIPGDYSYAFFDKYSINAPGAGSDNRELNIKVEGDAGIIIDRTYTHPSPDGTEGAVVGDFTIDSQGNYTISLDTEDSVYWALMECPICGDGVQEKEEECDEGEDNGRECEPEYGEECSYCSNSCELISVEGAFCGDGKINGSEQCDDGAENGEVCFPTYGGECSYCSVSCREVIVGGAFCGDGKVDEGEECDGEAGVGENQSCSDNCKLIDIPYCGNGSLDSGEECDDGNTVSGDGCSASCQKPDECSEICTSSIGCDGGLGCFSGMCRNENCSNEADCVCASCGDGRLDSGEECDDGNNVSGDGCSARCTTEEDEEDDEDCDGSIGNYIWEDLNGDGVQDSNEAGIEGVKVCAHDGNDKMCDSTNDSGRYKIKDLCEGDYDVRVRSTDLVGYSQTYDPDGKLDHKTDVELKGNNDHHTKADFGYRKAKVAPAAGINFPALLMISAALTAITLIIFELLQKKRKLKKSKK